MWADQRRQTSTPPLQWISNAPCREMPAPDGTAEWMLDTRKWPGTTTEYAEQLLSLADTLLSDPRHFLRSYSAAEIGRMTTAPAIRSVPAP
ncbi:hypothetical protein GCM10022420_017500 [Streptomyces iranensis]